MKRIGIGATLGMPDGEESHALDIALQMVGKGVQPVLLNVSDHFTIDPLRHSLLTPALNEYRAGRDALLRERGGKLPFPVLHRLDQRLAVDTSIAALPGSPDIGLASIERVDIGAANLERAAALPLILAGSSWCARMLRDKGLRNVLACLPGIDRSLFHPGPRAGLFPHRFLVFSGGLLAYGKGQDIVIAAFRVFRQRHPEAMLVCAWPALAPHGAGGLAGSPHIAGLPGAANGVLRLTPWLADNGIAPEAVLDLGPVSRERMPGILRECDLAVFPGRCEAMVPPYAMQALACGLPVVLACNTGYLDLAGEHAYLLKEQGDVAALTGDAGMEGWGECAVEELLGTMERAWSKRAEAAEKGRAGARFMEDWSWDRQADRLLAAVDLALAGRPVPPPGPETDYAWGLRLHRGGRLAEAERVYDAVLQLAPDHLSARGDRGNARRDLGDLAGAEADFRAILLKRPDYPRALHSLGNLLRRTGRLDEAAHCLRRALAGAPTPAMHWDCAFTLLLMGRYAEAWPHFEHRHAALGLRSADPAKPRWDGRPVTDGTLLVLDEQGLGDTVQFLRFLPLIPLGAGGRVIFAGKPAALPLVRKLLPDCDVFGWDGPLPRSQCWVPLMSLPARLGVARPEDIPAPPVLPADPDRVGRWRERVRGDGTLPVLGLCWRGNPDFPQDALRSPGLAALRPILEVAGLRFVSLQVGAGREQIAALGLGERLADVGGAIEAAGSNVLDTLAVLESCDFVISCCTSVAHLAGLAGRPGRVLLAHRPDWRWMTGRADTPWYPTLRLIRQRGPGEWAGVAAEAAAQLAALHETL